VIAPWALSSCALAAWLPVQQKSTIFVVQATKQARAQLDKAQGAITGARRVKLYLWLTDSAVTATVPPSVELEAAS